MTKASLISRRRTCSLLKERSGQPRMYLGQNAGPGHAQELFSGCINMLRQRVGLYLAVGRNSSVP